MVKKQYKLTQKTKYFVEKLREILPSKISSIKVFLFIFFELFFVTLNTENENCKILNVENEKKKKTYYNHGHYILRILVTVLNFLFTTSETKRDC